MNDATTFDAPYFDTHRLRVELTGIYRAAGESPTAARPLVLEHLKRLLAGAREAARLRLEADGKGRICAEGICRFEDELIRLIYDYTTTHVYRSDNPDDAEHMAVIATGGYGRGMLAPGSDIDLLFLLPYKQTAWGESVVEYTLMLLWDLGQKVGHAVRTVEQTIKLSLADMTIRTSVLDVRLILGDGALFDEFRRRFAAEVVRGSASQFFEAKLAERRQRHSRSGSSRYLVEPNIKDGKGGLRDLHTLHWLAKYLTGGTGDEDPIASSVFTRAEQSTFRRCEDFLWTVRCHLHFLAGRPEERLSFDRQPSLAGRLGYTDRGGLKGVERFMKHYFLVAKDVGDLTTILCAALEMQQLVRSPTMDALFDPLGWRTRRRIRRMSDFRIDNGRLNVADAKAFERDPVNLIRFFAYAEEGQARIHPAALRLIRQSLRLIDDKLRNDPEANRIFLGLLTAPGNPEATLRRMNEAGVLGRFVPDFGTVVSMMQFNMYHHYTVDEHLIRTVGVISEIVRGESEKAHPLSHRLIESVDRKRVLYVAAFLHDIAKGREEDHSVAGARIARGLCPRLGLDEVETELVSWLVLHHLDMSTVAQSRDLADPKTIRDFADVAGDAERLTLLLILTVADIRAVGPATWNGWKGQLLRTLYYQTLPLVEGRQPVAAAAERVASAKAALRAAAKDVDASAVEHFVGRHYDDYWLRTDTKRQLEHLRLAESARVGGRAFATQYATDTFTAVTELTILAPNHARLLSMFAGACAAAGANIVGAHITTTRDGSALDTFLLKREFDEDDDEQRRARRIGETIEKLLKGEVWLDQLMAKRRSAKGTIDAFTVRPEVTIDNRSSDQFTVVEVVGLDRPGLLYDVTAALSDLSLDITSAHITTFGERAVDAFYVTDLTSKKITSPQRQAAIHDRLTAVLRGDQELQRV
ncbi:MAG: [protein-PII] uridylyltransferase [Hyphomicrobiaceae bacterium]|nr:[protein-PII] uridylyltransferase [Hyphomicrobiaceae bacterium]